MTHQPRCPLDGALADLDCPTCEAIRGAVADQIAAWQVVLRDVERREYARGWDDGAGGHPARP